MGHCEALSGVYSFAALLCTSIPNLTYLIHASILQYVSLLSVVTTITDDNSTTVQQSIQLSWPWEGYWFNPDNSLTPRGVNCIVVITSKNFVNLTRHHVIEVEKSVPASGIDVLQTGVVMHITCSIVHAKGLSSSTFTRIQSLTETTYELSTQPQDESIRSKVVCWLHLPCVICDEGRQGASSTDSHSSSSKPPTSREN